jgi:hypothetical protein
LGKPFLPVPTWSQMLAAYPISHIRKLGHVHTFMLLDATEIFAEVASMKTVNSILYSAYTYSSIQSNGSLDVILLVQLGRIP